MQTDTIVNKDATLPNHNETALRVQPQVARRTHRFFLPVLMIAVLFVTTLAFYGTVNATSMPASSNQINAGGRAAVKIAPSEGVAVKTAPACMWVDIKGPNGVWTKMCYVPPTGE